MTTCTVRGVEFEFNPDVFDDLDTLDMVDEIMNGQPFKLKKLFVRIFGNQADKALELLKGEDGRVKASDADTLLGELFAEIGNSAKN